MFNYRVIALIKRELREKLLSKAFIIMTILLPVFMFGIIGIQTFIMSFDSEKSVVEIIAESETIAENLKGVIGEWNFIKDSTVIPMINSMSQMEFDDYVNKKQTDLLSEKISGIIFIPNSALEDKKIKYYSKTPKNMRLLERIDNPINRVLVEEYFQSKNINPEELQYARMSVNISSFKISEGEEIKEEGYGNLILSYLFSFLLYISLLMMGSMVMQTVIQEKSNRIVEVLLSSVTSKELMIGKILGAAITGLLQMAIWISPVILVASTSWFMLPENITIDITFLQVAYLLVNFFLGLLIFVGLFATVGSIFEDPQDAQSGMWPIMLLVMIPFFISMSMIENPSNPVATIASMSPFAAVIVMPAKMAMVDVPLWQIVLSTLVNVATVFAIFPIAGKIYRVGIMMTGKRPSWGEVVKWLKYKY
ncbi:MAG: ABC transporter permease [Melioribacteraceae bacterium]|jgi:ABC-2 type transport system permease protein|nr:ABC transporter permease [Melioribacteraceae bacterium]